MIRTMPLPKAKAKTKQVSLCVVVVEEIYRFFVRRCWCLSSWKICYGSSWFDDRSLVRSVSRRFEKSNTAHLSTISFITGGGGFVLKPAAASASKNPSTPSVNPTLAAENADAKPPNEDTKPLPFNFSPASFSVSNERPPPTPLRSYRNAVPPPKVTAAAVPAPKVAAPVIPAEAPMTVAEQIKLAEKQIKLAEKQIKLKELENEGKRIDASITKEKLGYLYKYTEGEQMLAMEFVSAHASAYASGSKDRADVMTAWLSPGRRRPRDQISSADDEGAVPAPPSALFVGASPTTPGTFAQDVPGGPKRRRVIAKRPASGA